MSEADAPKHIAGYCVVNDLSERAFQLERGGQWDKGKGCDTFGPLGPWLVTADEVGDPGNLAMWLDVNGTRRQNGSTRTMIFKPAFLVSYLSQFMSLHPGDVITTGTPPGVGMGIKPEPDFSRRRRRDGARHRKAGQPAPGRGRGIKKGDSHTHLDMAVINSIADLRELARRRLPRALFDYIDRGSYDELTLRAIAPTSRLQLRQRVMVDVSRLSLETTVLGERWNMPFAHRAHRASRACSIATAKSARRAPRTPPACRSA